jgi:predicted pyridoxine 5'-phosphate oxidase superfamily flavin-nucleotide-binding protein
MLPVDPELKDFLEGGVAAQAGTADPSGRPAVTNAWGPRVNRDGTVTVFFDTRRAGPALANLALNPRIAVVFADPVSYRSVQLKGRWRSTSAVSEEDRAWVQRHRELYASATVLVGDSPDSMRNMWGAEVTRVDFDVEAAFDQTPGPNAGLPL